MMNANDSSSDEEFSEQIIKDSAEFYLRKVKDSAAREELVPNKFVSPQTSFSKKSRSRGAVLFME